MQNSTEILAAISNLSDKHVLKKAPESYRRSFAEAALRVYPANSRAKLLQNKFFIPNDNAFNPETYLQSASELSVQNHLKHAEGAVNVEIEKKVNPPKDVDAYYEVGATKVSLEVKCAVEPVKPADSLEIRVVGRIPNHKDTCQGLENNFSSGLSAHSVQFGKNKDNTLKDFLVSANAKFNQNSGCDDLNILLVACGYYFDIHHWYQYLFEYNELFTESSFFPASEFALVDMVMLTNLKYCHTAAQQFHDWTLKDAFILPFVNPHRRVGASGESIDIGLGLFNHHLKGFDGFTPPDGFSNAFKVNSYITEKLEATERERYFPIKQTR